MFFQVSRRKMRSLVREMSQDAVTEVIAIKLPKTLIPSQTSKNKKNILANYCLSRRIPG
jgi:hypothetical protein